MIEIAGGILIAVAVLVALPLIIYLAAKAVQVAGHLLLLLGGGILAVGAIVLAIALLAPAAPIVGVGVGLLVLAAGAVFIADPIAFSNWLAFRHLPENTPAAPPPMPKRGTAEHLQWANREGPWADR